MPGFYHLPFGVLFSTVCSAILTVGFIWLIRKRKIYYVIPLVLTFWPVSWVAMIVLVNFISYPIQAAIAVPYIQVALDEASECDGYGFIADARGFYVDSDGYGWTSEDSRATCYHSEYMDMFLLAINEKAVTKMRHCHSQIPSGFSLVLPRLMVFLFSWRLSMA